MNQYPTLFLSLKDVDGTTFENAFNMLKFVISSLCSQNSYLETGENIRENEKGKGCCNNHEQKKQNYGIKIPKLNKKWHAKKTYAAA